MQVSGLFFSVYFYFLGGFHFDTEDGLLTALHIETGIILVMMSITQP